MDPFTIAAITGIIGAISSKFGGDIYDRIKSKLNLPKDWANIKEMINEIDNYIKSNPDYLNENKNYNHEILGWKSILLSGNVSNPVIKIHRTAEINGITRNPNVEYDLMNMSKEEIMQIIERIKHF